MYNTQSQKVIDYWIMLEDKYENASMILYNKLTNIYISISNNNVMKYVDVCIINCHNNQKTFEQYTHIHSFINDMISLHCPDILQDYDIKNTYDMNKKRCIDNVVNEEDNKIKRAKCQ